jgi:predicted dehydrogenase
VPAPLRIGFVGCGRVTTQMHLPALRRVGGVEAAGAHDVDPTRAAAAGPPVFADVAALAAHVDLVAVCSPPRTHAAAALAALEAGRHVLVEKPLTLDSDEAAALVDAAAERGVTAAVGFNLRVHRQVLEARAALARGQLGRLRAVRTLWTAGERSPGWRADPDQGGAGLWEMGIHHLDLWRLLAGAPADHLPGAPSDALGGAPSGHLRVQASGDENAFTLAARTSDGVALSTTVVAGTGDANEVELVGDRGRLTLTLYRGDGPHWAPAGEAAGGPGPRARAVVRAARSLPRQAKVARVGGDYLASYAAQWEAVRDAVRTGGPPPATFEDGRAAVALAAQADATLRAAERAPVEGRA